MIKYVTTNNLPYLQQMPDHCIDSIVTDGPYGLGKEPDPIALLRDWIDHGYHEVTGSGFMGKKWDAFVPQPIFWRECFRVLKPGGYLLNFFGTRTYDWGVLAIRLAGFEIRDQIAWIYSTGFPKSSNQDGQWSGWGTALKPAMEPIVVARKPLDGTVAKNLSNWGVGAINVDACRVEFASDQDRSSATFGTQTDLKNEGYGSKRPSDGHVFAKSVEANVLGRWPANIIHDGSNEVLAMFPESQGQLGKARNDNSVSNNKVFGKLKNVTKNPAPRSESTTSASRFFYCAKPSQYERNRGLEDFEKRIGGMRSETSGQHITRRDGGAPEPVANFHPTVKPIALMRYLVRLVTPIGGTVLDPFSGSGTTGIACELEQMSRDLLG